MTDTTNEGQQISATVDFRELAIQKVLKKAEEWFEMHDCRGTDRFCEQFGCECIEELLEPLKPWVKKRG